MDRLLSVIKDHETDEEMDQWKVWLKYFVTMGVAASGMNSGEM